MSKIAFVGDLTVDVYTNLKQTKLGGSSLNQAVWTRRMGDEPVIIGRVGDDDFGKKYLSFLKNEKINSEGVIVAVGKTSQIEIFVDEKGERSYGDWVKGVCEKFHLQSEDILKISTCQAVCLPVYFPTKHLLPEVISAKKTNNNPEQLIVADFDDFSQYDKKLDFLLQNLEGVDFVFCGLDQKLDKTLIEELKELAKTKKKNIVVTLNEKGSMAFISDQSFFQKAQNVKVVDSTGGGDAYIAGFISEYLKNQNIQSSMKNGTELATLAISKIGAY